MRLRRWTRLYVVVSYTRANGQKYVASPLARRASRLWWRRRPSYYDKKLAQNILRIHLNNGRQILVYEVDAADALERLGLGEFVQDWTLNIERDVV